MLRRSRISRRGPQSYRAIGLVVALLIGAAVYISARSPSGLPWESPHRLRVDVPNAQRLVRNDDVRIAGLRVGSVSEIDAVPARTTRQPHARVTLKLDRSVGAVPADTRVRLRSASPLGATYVELIPGRSETTVPDGGTLRLENASESVQLVDLLGIFDRATANSIRTTLGELGSGIAGRGVALNQTLGSTNELLPPARRTAELLADPSTRLAPFLRAYRSTVRALDPVSGQLAHGIEGAATTFGALASERSALGDTIEALPGTERDVTEGLTRLRKPLDGLSRLVSRLQPAGRMLRGTLSQVNSTIVAGTPPLRRLPGLSERADVTLRTLGRVSRLASTPGALRKLRDTVNAVRPALELLAPAQAYCNSIALFGIGFGNGTAGGDLGGIQGLTPFGLVSGGAQGSMFQSAKPAADLHVNYLPHETASECESGNGSFDPNRQQLANPPGNQPRTVPDSDPPPGVLARAAAAGLLDKPPAVP